MCTAPRTELAGTVIIVHHSFLRDGREGQGIWACERWKGDGKGGGVMRNQKIKVGSASGERSCDKWG